MQRLHLFLGLPIGVVLFIVAITGAIYGLKPEVERYERRSIRAIEPRGVEELLPPERLLAKGQAILERLPQEERGAITGITYYGLEQPVRLSGDFAGSKRATLYLDPYTGDSLHLSTADGELFRWAMAGHRHLWLPRAVGKPIIGWSMIGFLLITLTGLFLWFPQRQTGKAWKRALLIKRSGNRYSHFFSLHSVLGFYTAIFALAVAITGLTWSFRWYNKAYYSLLSGGKELPAWSRPESQLPPEGMAAQQAASMDALWGLATNLYPISREAASLYISIPQKPTDVYMVSYNPEGDEGFSKSEYHFYDRYTLEKLEGGGLRGKPYESLTGGERFYRLSYDIHSGSIFGRVGRLAAVLCSLILAFMPLSGVYLWWRKRHPKKRASRA